MGEVRASMDRSQPRDSLDSLAEELQATRASAGMSYRTIAARIGARRAAAGMAPAAAQIAHSTVSDSFRTGRSRLNVDLSAEIVNVLGGDGDAWRERCVRAMSPERRTPSSPEITEVVPPRIPHPAATGPVALGLPASGDHSVRTIMTIVVGAVLLNSAGKFVNPLVGDLLFFDMIGTAVAALLLGPWWAMLVGVLFAGVQLLKGDIADALFATSMITAGLIWGVGVRRFDLGRTLPRFLLLSAVVALTTTAIAVPIIVLYLGGQAGRGADGFVEWASGTTNLWVAVGTMNVPISLVDKLLTGALAFGLARLLTRPKQAPPRFDTVGVTPAGTSPGPRSRR